MIYPQLVQPSTPASPLHLTLLTPCRNLLCHPDLPALSHSKLTTTHGWSQDVSCPLARFAPAQVKASGLTVGGQSTPSTKTSVALSNPMETCCKKESSLLCGQQKHFSSCPKAIKHFTLDVWHAKTSEWTLTFSPPCQRLCLLQTVRDMGHYLGHQIHSHHIIYHLWRDFWLFCWQIWKLCMKSMYFFVTLILHFNEFKILMAGTHKLTCYKTSLTI